MKQLGRQHNPDDPSIFPACRQNTGWPVYQTGDGPNDMPASSLHAETQTCVSEDLRVIGCEDSSSNK
jgi:hypothetical protein